MAKQTVKRRAKKAVKAIWDDHHLAWTPHSFDIMVERIVEQFYFPPKKKPAPAPMCRASGCFRKTRKPHGFCFQHADMYKPYRDRVKGE